MVCAWAFLGAIAVLASCGLAAFTPNLAFNICISDASPLLSYLNADGTSANHGINDYHFINEAGLSVPDAKQDFIFGSGESRHLLNGTSYKPVTALVRFYGHFVAFQLRTYGHGTSTFTVSVPETGQTYIYSDVALSLPGWISVGSLGSWSDYSAQLNISTDASVFRALVTTGIQTQASDITQVVSRGLWLSDFHQKSNLLDWSGNWTLKSSVSFEESLGETRSSPWSQVIGGKGASATIDLPANTSFLILNGTSSSVYRTAQFTFTPPPPVYYPPSVWTSKSRTDVVTTLLFTPLDPTEQYNFKITASDGPIALSSIVLYSGLTDVNWAQGFGNFRPERLVAPTSLVSATLQPRAGPGIATIAGGAAAGGVTLLGVVIFFIVRRIRRRRKRELFMVDDGPLFGGDGSAVVHSPYIRDAHPLTLDEASGEQSILEPTDERPTGNATQRPLPRVSNVKGSLVHDATTAPALRLASPISTDEDQVTAVAEIDSLLSPAPLQTEQLGAQVPPISKEEEANVVPTDPNSTRAIERPLDVGESSSTPQGSGPMQYLRAQDGVAVTEILPPEYDPQWKGPLASGAVGEGDGSRS